MRQLIIPAAGHSTRFGSPKLLAEVTGEKVIARALRHAYGLFDQILILVPEDYGLPNQVLVEAGTGSAGALRSVFSRLADDVTVLWSDIVLVGDTLKEILDQPLRTAVAPYVPEIRPYCHLEIKDGAVARVDYGKPLIGNHDQGVFRFRGHVLRKALAQSRSNLLECFEWLDQSDSPVMAYRTSFPTLGFNDPAKLKLINELL